MRDFLLDTQTVRYWYDSRCPQNQAVVANITSLRKQVGSSEHKPRLLVSVITLGEIEFGHRVNPSPTPHVQAEYLAFVNEQLPDRWDVTEAATAAFGELRKRLFDKYAPGEKRKPKMRPEQLIDPITSKELGIQENDLWLCAQAVGAPHGVCDQRCNATNPRGEPRYAAPIANSELDDSERGQARMTYRWRLVDLFGEYGVVQLRRGRGDLEAGTRCRTCTFHIFASPEEPVGGACPPALCAAVSQE